MATNNKDIAIESTPSDQGMFAWWPVRKLFQLYFEFQGNVKQNNKKEKKRKQLEAAEYVMQLYSQLETSPMDHIAAIFDPKENEYVPVMITQMFPKVFHAGQIADGRERVWIYK